MYYNVDDDVNLGNNADDGDVVGDEDGDSRVHSHGRGADEDDDDDDGDKDDNDDDDDDYDDDHDDGDAGDDEKERKMVMWILWRRKMAKLTRMMLRRKIDSQTGKKAYFCASLRSQSAHGHFRRDILCGNRKGKWPGTPLGHDFVRACAVDMHMGISEEQFRLNIYRKDAKRFCYHLD